MNEPVKRWMAAMALSMVLPRAIVSLGSRWQYISPQPQETISSSVATTNAPTESRPVTQTIPVLMTDGTLRQMDLEDYIRGVVLAEMPASFEMDALKAQAVAARTYALRRQTLTDRHPQGAVCADHTCCQAWMSDEDYLKSRGTKLDLEKVRDAVNETAGQVLTYEGRLAETTYFSCSGGQTEDAAAVWGEEIPYLQSVVSPGEEGSAEYEQTLYFTSAEFADKLGRKLTGMPSQWLGEATETEGGGVATMVIGGVTYSGTELRRLLGLNSTIFTMEADEAGITVTTRGNGHRVGMSQYGADAMAVAGSSYTEILAYYYPGTVIDKLSDVE